MRSLPDWIRNALAAAADMIGFAGHRAPASPHDELQRAMARYRPDRD